MSGEFRRETDLGCGSGSVEIDSIGARSLAYVTHQSSSKRCRTILVGFNLLNASELGTGWQDRLDWRQIVFFRSDPLHASIESTV